MHTSGDVPPTVTPEECNGFGDVKISNEKGGDLFVVSFGSSFATNGKVSAGDNCNGTESGGGDWW